MSPRTRTALAVAAGVVVVVALAAGWRAVAGDDGGRGGRGDDEVPSRDEIRDHLADEPAGDPAAVQAHLDGPGGQLRTALGIGQRAVAAADPAAACDELAALDDLPAPDDLVAAAATTPDPVLREGYGALVSRLGRAGAACRDGGGPAGDEAQRLELVVVGVEERLAQLGVEG